LEALQPHISAGIDLPETLDMLNTKDFNTVIKQLYKQTKLTYGNSFLWERDEELYKRLGVPDNKVAGNA